MGDRKHAMDLYNAGVMAANDKSKSINATTAYQLFVSACQADPLFGQAWYHTGNANSDLNMLPASVACYRRALECENEPKAKAKILCNIGWRLHCLGQTAEAFQATMEALQLDEDLAYAWLNLSLIHGIMENTRTSVDCARKAYDLLPSDTTVGMALSFALLFDRQFEEAFRQFECRFQYRLHSFLHYPYPRWTGESDATVFLVADQGLGDTLSFARFVEQAAGKCKFLHLCVQPELMRLFQHAFRTTQNINLIPMGTSTFPLADYWTTFVSLPFALKLTTQQIRDAKDIELPIYTHPAGKTWKIPDRQLHIGISWAGSPLNDIDKHRNIPVTQFLELFRVPGIQLYGLQVGEKAKELHDNGCAAVIKDLSPYIRDVTDTVSLLQELDLIITCESALGHIAAAASKECWIPYSYCGRDYRIGMTGEDRLWTPKHRIFRQGNAMQWGPVFENIAGALEKRLRPARAEPQRPRLVEKAR